MANDASPWPTVTFLGVLCGITFGLVLYSLLRRHDDTGGLPALPDDLGLGSLPQVNMVPSRGKSQPLLAAKASVARTLTLSSSPTMVLRATGNCNWKVTVRVISPISTFARFSVGHGATDSILVPSGSSQDMWVPKGEYLFATGSEAGVCVSVSGGRG
jgi:hypothetical protein